MILNNPIFRSWYTDTVDIYRTEGTTSGNIDRKQRKKINDKPIPCRIYSTKRDGPMMTDTAAGERATEKMACDLAVDIRAGDELLIVRGGKLEYENPEERYFAGEPIAYYDPVGGALTGLQHKAVGLLKDNLIGR